jgi:hypothetical protein
MTRGSWGVYVIGAVSISIVVSYLPVWVLGWFDLSRPQKWVISGALVLPCLVAYAYLLVSVTLSRCDQRLKP